MKLIPKYQKARKFNIEWIKDKDVNGNVGYRNIKTGQFRSTLPKSVEEKQKDLNKRNKAALLTYSSQKAKFDRTQAHRRNHSDETIKKVLKVPQLVSNKQGIMSNTSIQQNAPNEDSAQIDNTFENFIVGDKLFRLSAGVGKLALSKIGNGILAHKARNSLLNETAGNLTKNLNNPIMEFQEVPLEDGFVYRTFTPSHGGFVKNNLVYNRSYGIGDVKVQNGKYYSVRQAHFNNPDKLWWDKFGHNRGRVVQVTKESNTQTLQDAANNGFNLGYGYYTKGYRLSDPIEINKVINYKFDPITNTLVPSMPGKIINNKQTPSEILSAPIANNYSYLKNTYTGFKGVKPKLNHHLQGEDAVKMFKEYGGTPIPEGSLNGDQLRKYVMEARERYGLIDNPNISDEEIAQALYKHTNELGKGSAAINSQGEPQLLFRGDTKAYTQLKDHPSPTDLATKSGTMDNSLGTLFLGELPGMGQKAGGLERYLVRGQVFKGDPKLIGSGTGAKVLGGDGKYHTEIRQIIPKDARPLVTYHTRFGDNMVYKLPAKYSESKTNNINAFVVRTPAVRDASKEISVLNDDWLIKGGSKVNYHGPLNPTNERSAMAEHYDYILKDAQKKQQGLLKSNPNSPLRDEHVDYTYFAVPNWNKFNVKSLLPYDLRIPRDWSDPNIFRIAAPIGMSLPFLNNSQK